MFGGMKNKLQEMQQKMEETKARLDTISVSSDSKSGNIRVIVSGNRKIVRIEINNKAAIDTTEELTETINEALAKAEKVSEAELSGIAQGMLPNLPGMFK